MILRVRERKEFLYLNMKSSIGIGNLRIDQISLSLMAQFQFVDIQNRQISLTSVGEKDFAKKTFKVYFDEVCLYRWSYYSTKTFGKQLLFNISRIDWIFSWRLCCLRLEDFNLTFRCYTRQTLFWASLYISYHDRL